ncbi:MAG: ABC transporter substrate-binding protein [Chloroflexi bacterium]|nr:ABC transporter substrate-binding protein [Chloroflexota bacterium]
MVKRLALLAIIAALAVSLAPTFLSGDAAPVVAQEVDCGTEEEVTINFIAGSVGNEGDAANAQIAQFMEACPNVTVALSARPDSTTEGLALYLQFFEAESSDVDVYQFDVIHSGVFAEHLIDLAEYIDQEVIDSHFDAIILNNTVDGRLVGLPWFTDAGLLYYRTDLLEKYGYEGPPVTWEELEEMAATIQEGERAEGNADFWGFVWQGNAYEGLTCDALEWQESSGGGVIITPEGVVDVNNEAAIDIFDRAAGWVGTISPEGVISFMEEDARSVWQAGNAAFMRNWPYAYSLGKAEDSTIADVFDVSALPGGEEGESAATLGGWQLGVSAYSENPEAAAAFVNFIASEEGQKFRAINHSYLATIETVYSDEEVLEAVPFFGPLFDVFTNAVARPSTVSGTQYPEVSELYYTAVHNVLTGETDAETALADLEGQLIDLGFEAPEME